MKFLFGKREEFQDKPRMHALIIGISKYPHLTTKTVPGLGIGSNTSAAITGYRIYQWLINHKHQLAVPLATCRLMLSPSSEEIEAEPALKEFADSCNLDNFLLSANEWRNDAQTHRDNMTFFYFAGNGFELSKSNPVLMLEDFGNGIGPVLRSSVTVNNLFYGMGPTGMQSSIARTQLYFIDTDRILLSESFPSFGQMNTTAVFDAVPLGIDERDAVIFYATSSGNPAYAYIGNLTMFSYALLKCLEGAAAVPREEDQEGGLRWVVSVSSLMSSLGSVLRDLSQVTGIKQMFEAGGQIRDSIVCYLDSPPPVEISIEIDPVEALPVSNLEIRDEEGNLVLESKAPLGPYPFQVRLLAGLYTLDMKIDPPDPSFRNIQSKVYLAKPPRSMWKVRVVS